MYPYSFTSFNALIIIQAIAHSLRSIGHTWCFPATRSIVLELRIALTMDTAGVGTKTYSKAGCSSPFIYHTILSFRLVLLVHTTTDTSLVKKQVHLEQQRRAEEEKNGTEREGEDRRKKRRVNR
jgi:hypothetical protein